MLALFRKVIWRLLGFDYNQMLQKTDFTLLKHDVFTQRGVGTYDNGAKVWRWSNALIQIGNYCSIAHGVNFIADDGFHTQSKITNYPFINNKSIDLELLDIKEKFIHKQGIIIGNDVWIGLGCTILPGVKIGNGVTLAAGSVVDRDVPDYTLAGGVPARVIRQKYSNDEIQSLLKISWWNWNEEKLRESKLDFYKLSVSEFIKKHE